MAIGRTNAKALGGGEPIPAWKDPLWVDIEKLYEDNYNFDTWTPVYNYRTFALISASDNETVLPSGFDYQTSDGVWYTGGTGGTHTWDKIKDFTDSKGLKYRWIAFYTNDIKSGNFNTFPNFNRTLIWVIFGNKISSGLAGLSSINNTYNFSRCPALVSFEIMIDIENTFGANTFNGDYSLQNVNWYNEIPLSIGSNCFNSCCSLKEIQTNSAPTGAWDGCNSLEKLKIVSIASIYAGQLTLCENLKKLELFNGFNSNNWNISASSLFNQEALVDIINKLADRSATTAYTFTVGAENLAKLTAAEILVATNKNWTLS